MGGKEFGGTYVGLEGDVNELLKNKRALLMRFGDKYYLAQFDDTTLEEHFPGGLVHKYGYGWYIFHKECFLTDE